jgi:DNA-binding transcriptional LysR family regulator
MELRHLRYFVAVAEEGTLGRAATRLHIAQSPLARQIRDLERHLGVALFERLPRGLRLTPAGASFLVDARRIVAEAASAAERVRMAGPGVAGPLRVGHAEYGVAGAIVREATLRFGRQYPEVQLSVDGAGILRQEAAVRAGRLDVGFCFEVDPADSALATEVLWEETLTGALLPAAHPLADRPSLTLHALAALPVVIVPRRLAPRLSDALGEHLRARGLVSTIRQDIDNAGSLFAVIGAGSAWAVAAETPREHLPPAIVYRPVPEIRFGIVHRMFWRRGGATPALLAFLAAVAHVCDEHRTARQTAGQADPIGEGTVTEKSMAPATASLHRALG